MIMWEEVLGHLSWQYREMFAIRGGKILRATKMLI